MKIIKKNIIVVKEYPKSSEIEYHNEEFRKIIANKMGHDPEFFVAYDYDTGFYISEYFGYGYIFSFLNMYDTRYEFQEKVLGYTERFGNSPYCKTSEDAAKLLDELLNLVIYG